MYLLNLFWNYATEALIITVKKITVQNAIFR